MCSRLVVVVKEVFFWVCPPSVAYLWRGSWVGVEVGP